MSFTAQKARLWLCLAIYAFSFLFIRIYNTQQVFLLFNEGDDAGYVAYSEALLQTHSLNWCDERARTAFCEVDTATGKAVSIYNKYSPGAALAVAPFTLFGFGLHRLGIFTPGPGTVNPIRFWTIVGNFFLFLGGALFLFELTNLWLSDPGTSFWLTLFFCAGNLVVYFVFRRPLMAHAPEFFFFLGAFYYLSRLRHSGNPLRAGLICGLFAGMLAIARLSSVYVLGIIPVLIFFDTALPLERRLRKLFGFGAGCALPVSVYLISNFVQKGAILTSPTAYDPWLKNGLYFRYMASNPHRILDFFVGPHWGAFWMMPILLIETVFITSQLRALAPLIRKYRLAIIAISLFQLNMQANYGSNSMSYGNRYLITQWCSLHMLFLLALRFGKVKLRMTRPVFAGFLLAAVIASFNLLNFESNGSTLTLTPHPLGEEGIYDPDFQNWVMLSAPNYVMHSLKETFTGRAVKNVAAAPMIAYPLIALQNTFVARLPGVPAALDYYHSPKRNIFDIGDLALLFQYQMWVLVLLMPVLWALRRRREPS